MFDSDGSPDRSRSHIDPTYVTSFDPGDRPSEAVVTAVAELTGDDPTDLSPLYGAIEPDALDGLFDHGRRAGEPARHRLSFAYAGFDVEVRGDGSIIVGTRSPAPETDGGD